MSQIAKSGIIIVVGSVLAAVFGYQAFLYVAFSSVVDPSLTGRDRWSFVLRRIFDFSSQETFAFLIFSIVGLIGIALVLFGIWLALIAIVRIKRRDS
jgi:hypothetical protein